MVDTISIDNVAALLRVFRAEGGADEPIFIERIEKGDIIAVDHEGRKVPVDLKKLLA